MNPAVSWIIGGVFWLALIANYCWSDELIEPEYRFDVAGEVSDAMADLLSAAPRRQLYRDHVLRRQYAEAIVAAAEKHGVPELLQVSQYFNESSFRIGALACDRPTIGMGQIHTEGVAAKDCDLSTMQGQVNCSAKFLRTCFDLCVSRNPTATWRNALIAYATEGHCESKTEKTNWSANRRMRLWQALEQQRESVRNEIVSDLEFYKYGGN